MSDVLVQRLDKIIEAQRQVVLNIETDLKAAKARLDDFRRDREALIRVYNIAESVAKVEQEMGLPDDSEQTNDSGESET